MIYNFLLTGLLIYLAQLFFILLVIWVMVLIVGWPIKRFIASIIRIVNRGTTPRL